MAFCRLSSAVQGSSVSGPSATHAESVTPASRRPSRSPITGGGLPVWEFGEAMMCQMSVHYFYIVLRSNRINTGWNGETADKKCAKTRINCYINYFQVCRNGSSAALQVIRPKDGLSVLFCDALTVSISKLQRNAPTLPSREGLLDKHKTCSPFEDGIIKRLEFVKTILALQSYKGHAVSL